jgi:mannose-1-phosphate guanylyltransferase
MIYGVVMAGGSGTRFWPRSREARAKQFLPIFGDRTLIESTLNRLHPAIKNKDIFIITKQSQKKAFSKLLLDIPGKNILFEPIGKDTAPCIGLAAIHIQKRSPDAVMVVTPADHMIENEPLFRETVAAAADLAGRGNGLVTIGIVPDRPATGYGYIQIEKTDGRIRGIETCRVKTFAEKPDLSTAKSFLASGDFFWNSGIFAFKASVYLKQVEEFLPEMHEGLMEIQAGIGHRGYEETLDRIYRQIRAISIDFGVMEKAKNVFMVKGEFPWSDLGSWEQVYKLSPKDGKGNAVSGNAVLVDTGHSFIRAGEKPVAVLGLDHVVVVQEPDVTLICHIDRTEDIKKLIDKLRNNKMTDVL